MRMSPIRYVLAATAAAVTLGLVASCATAPSAPDVIARASKAMGSPQTLRYAGEGIGWTFGQAYEAGQAWPKVTYHSIVRTVDYGAAAMRDEIVLSRAEPRGGGGYPLAGQQRNDQYLNGELAWNVVNNNVVPGARFVADRIHQLWITPHGALLAAQRHNASVAPGAAGSHVLSFTQPGRVRA
jgi:hypothetical protein